MSQIKFDYERSIFDMIPNEYRDYKESEQYIEASDEEFARYYDYLSDVVNQVFIVNSTWGIGLFENIYGLDKSDASDVERRRRLIAYLAGANVSTIKNLEHMLNELTGIYEAEITEYNSDYYFYVNIPVADSFSLEDVTKLLETYKPAHLAYLIATTNRDKVRVASASLSGEETSVFPYTAESIELKTESKRGTGLYTQEIIELRTEGD